MRLAVFRAMALSLWRDRAAFLLAFVLPAAIFAIFSVVFSSAAGGDMKITLAVMSAEDAVSRRLADGLAKSDAVALIVTAASRGEMERAVREGRADAGIEIAFPQGAPAPSFRLYADATRGGAALVAESALARLAPRTGAAADAKAERVFVNPVNAQSPMAAYFAAGVAMLFLFLSGFQSALSLLEERDAGVMERVAAGPAGVAAAIDGKFAFIVLQGLAQIGVILAAAALFFRVELSYAPFALALAAAAAALCASGLTLAVTALCRTRAQAHAVGAVLSLVMAALGGSMAPKFLMPLEIQRLGAATPNSLGIDAFSASLWTGGGFETASGPAAILAAMGLAGLAFAHLAGRFSLRSDA